MRFYVVMKLTAEIQLCTLSSSCNVLFFFWSIQRPSPLWKPSEGLLLIDYGLSLPFPRKIISPVKREHTPDAWAQRFK